VGKKKKIKKLPVRKRGTFNLGGNGPGGNQVFVRVSKRNVAKGMPSKTGGREKNWITELKKNRCRVQTPAD